MLHVDVLTLKGKIESKMYQIGSTRIICDRVQNSKNHFEIPAFLPIERGISRAGKFKVMLHFAATEIYLFVFLFSFEFPALEVPRSKFKKAAISK